MTKVKILVVEDEEAIRRGLEDVLVFHGYDVTGVADGRVGLETALSGQFDLLILDVMLPEVDGFTICNEVRAVNRDVPILMLTAKSAEEDIINGLSLGADDYVPKPFSVRVLIMRIEALLRRTGKSKKMEREISLGEYIVIDTENLNGRYVESGEGIEFSRREIELLQYLNEREDVPVSREELLVKVWGYTENSRIETRTVDIHIAKLRRKIEPDSKEPCYLVTVRGKGYRLDGVNG